MTRRFYEELHGIAQGLFARQRGPHTLQPTAVVHEACVRLLSSSKLPDVPREQRLALAARVLQQVLIDHARAKGAQKRGGGGLRVELELADAREAREAGEAGEASRASVEALDYEKVHAALERLTKLHPRQAEVVSLRAFGGLTMAEIARTLGVAKRTVEGDWAVARAWLRRELSSLGGSE